MTTHAASQQVASIPTIHNPSAGIRVRLRPEQVYTLKKREEHYLDRVSLSTAELDALYDARRRKGLLLKTVAERIGVRPHLLARYQSGERRPPQAVLQAWRRELSDV